MQTLAWLLLVLLPVAESSAGLVNLSARGVTAAGAEVLTAGFVIAGETPKRVLVRAAGPALTGLGVTGALAQVRLEVFRNATLLAFTPAAGVVGKSMPAIPIEGLAQTKAKSLDDYIGRAVLVEFFAYW